MTKIWHKGAAALIATVLLGGLLAGCTGSGSDNRQDGDSYKLKVLHNWNGSTGSDQGITPIEEVIREKTGITIEWEYTKGSEAEKVNTIFATQDLPDIYTGPAWGGELDGIIKAANEGQLVDISDKLANYPNLQKSIAKENVPPALYEKAFDAFDGKQYLLLQNQPATNEDGMDWLYGFYVRKDIAEAVGVDPQSVVTKDDFYQFLRKIKDANLQENGQPVFPLGGFSNGWAVGIGNTMFFGSNYVDRGDGNLEHVFFRQEYEEYTLFYRKLIEEGLLDPEVFTQTDPIAKEKINQGRIAVLAAHYPAILDASKEYVTANPGSDYIPLGPLDRAGAAPDRPVDLAIQGNNVTAITKNCQGECVDKALELLDFLASDEGFLLTRYGVEGVHWEMVDGTPKPVQEWFDKFAEDASGKERKNVGIGIGLESLTGLDRINSAAGGDIWADQKRTEAMENARAILRPNGIQVISAYNPGDVITKSPDWEMLKPSLDRTGDAWTEAVFAKSDEAALRILNDLRDQMKKTGYDNAMEYVNENLKGKEVVTLQMPN
ncbi:MULTISPECIES: extracellular solute-binding protein [Paenibacillus]|uniref:ABC transporter substrate-binding protein n=1 Tax=Paenibacillus campinasensis TaxID=66347 RepID=A0A268EQ72_9BACL|nr:extracellular solute-binding protein [Paenibacillus campinasensis]PAD75246.1 ABC transporter substrate-binding protein [Paenibacillus campinasensis]